MDTRWIQSGYKALRADSNGSTLYRSDLSEFESPEGLVSLVSVFPKRSLDLHLRFVLLFGINDFV